jgi:hypothetical protein
MSTTKPDSTPLPGSPQAQRDALIESERAANAQQPRNFKEEALTDKVVSVEPDGTGPTSTKTFDTKVDRNAGSGQEDS